jgi:hypothetical protein
VRPFLLIAAAITLTSPAAAWTRPAHMVSAAIAYDDLAASDPGIIAAAGALLEAHPDHGPFQVAIDRATGEERLRRLFLQCPRWADDVRETGYDNPTWHYAFATLDASRAVTGAPVVGDAREAFALNVRVLANKNAPAANRGVALCWVMHQLQDIHQPLHAAQIALPGLDTGDSGGGRHFVRDPLTGDPISLHWLWDDSVHRSGDVTSVTARARELSGRYPRATLGAGAPALAAGFPNWREESITLARTLAYADGFPDARTAEAAKPAPRAYLDAMTPAAERRLTLAGYRLADVLREALRP